ncbi:fumarylacetoacetate hydrolase family protein [Hydrogenophaga sp. BPS33]|uniref:fumarylacetoacetate hydrolase family protein n=1 Tax=Hydrogenophaga sp. BPS33 TaxID=2651974 RepID=UPI00131F76B6|nr:fumarylacetoacetate hydrolase family protein [Hydrogenophaga sp. BPS33]QHE84536.1 fumarylacetoacetate hydrolase family protein [Hydrogenophaga sp. BPS33]
MKIVRYNHSNRAAWGVVQDERIVPLQGLPDTANFAEVLLAAGQAAGDALDQRPRGLPLLSSVELLPPLTATAMVYCVGINYRAHANEAGRELPPHPSLFIRRQASLVGAHQALEYPQGSTQFDFEGELALVIGRTGRHIAPDEAWRHIAAYTCLNDGSVRDFQKHSVTAGKNFEGSGACGPWLVSTDEVPDPNNLTLVTRLNGQEMQRANTSQLIYPIAQLVSYVSRFARLLPGDVISTGTPEGVGAARTPPVWMKPGDHIEVEIAGIGVLGNPVRGAVSPS